MSSSLNHSPIYNLASADYNIVYYATGLEMTFLSLAIADMSNGSTSFVY